MKNNATQTIKVNIMATSDVFEKLCDSLFDNIDEYEITFTQELEKTDNSEFNTYLIEWTIYGWTLFYRSHDWYSPDEWECSEYFISDNSEVIDIINSYAKYVGIDSDLYDIDNIRIGDIDETYDDLDY